MTSILQILLMILQLAQFIIIDQLASTFHGTE